MRFALVTALCLAACGKSGAGSSPACTRYADMEIKCGGDTGEGARSTIVEYCQKAQGGATDIMSQMLVLEIKCAGTTSECPAYQACIDKAKTETTPKL